MSSRYRIHRVAMLLAVFVAACSDGNGHGGGGGGHGGGGDADAGSGGTGTGGGTTHGSGGAGGDCWIPTQFPIEVATAGAAIADYSSTMADLVPFVCLSAAVWPIEATSPWD